MYVYMSETYITMFDLCNSRWEEVVEEESGCELEGVLFRIFISRPKTKNSTNNYNWPY